MGSISTSSSRPHIMHYNNQARTDHRRHIREGTCRVSRHAAIHDAHPRVMTELQQPAAMIIDGSILVV